MTRNHPGEITAALAGFSHRDRARIVREARRMRAEAITELIRTAGQGLMRTGRAVVELLASRTSPSRPARSDGGPPAGAAWGATG